MTKGTGVARMTRRARPWPRRCGHDAYRGMRESGSRIDRGTHGSRHPHDRARWRRGGGEPLRCRCARGGAPHQGGAGGRGFGLPRKRALHAVSRRRRLCCATASPVAPTTRFCFPTAPLPVRTRLRRAMRCRVACVSWALAAARRASHGSSSAERWRSMASTAQIGPARRPAGRALCDRRALVRKRGPPASPGRKYSPEWMRVRHGVDEGHRDG